MQVESRSRRLDEGPWEREVLWGSLDGRGFEHLVLKEGREQILADGMILRLDDAGSCRVRYRIELDQDWSLRSLFMARLDDSSQVVRLASDGAGHWSGPEGGPIEVLDGCRDLDIQASPFTNTLAIRRLALEEEASRELRVVFATVPGLEVRAMGQRYTRLASGQGAGLYRYESLESPFTALLPVDEAGLLLEYPGYFKRLWAAKRSIR